MTPTGIYIEVQHSALAEAGSSLGVVPFGNRGFAVGRWVGVCRQQQHVGTLAVGISDLVPYRRPIYRFLVSLALNVPLFDCVNSHEISDYHATFEVPAAVGTGRSPNKIPDSDGTDAIVNETLERTGGKA